jgi:hypothetical protein
MTDGPATFYRSAIETSGALQVSWAENQEGTMPSPTRESLQEMAEGFGPQIGATDLVESSCGKCDFGNWGTSVFRSDKFSRVQVWFLSNGRDFIMATHICTESLDPIEIAEAQLIVESLGLDSE